MHIGAPLTHGNGPLLVFAGAGTGNRVPLLRAHPLFARVGRLLFPRKHPMLDFTDKAAGEIKLASSVSGERPKTYAQNFARVFDHY